MSICNPLGYDSPSWFILLVTIRKSKIFYQRICSQHTSDKCRKCSYLCLKTKKIKKRYFLGVPRLQKNRELFRLPAPEKVSVFLQTV